MFFCLCQIVLVFRYCARELALLNKINAHWRPYYVNGFLHASATHTLHDVLLKFNYLTSIALNIKGTLRYTKEYNIALIADFHYRHEGLGWWGLNTSLEKKAEESYGAESYWYAGSSKQCEFPPFMRWVEVESRGLDLVLSIVMFF